MNIKIVYFNNDNHYQFNWLKCIIGANLNKGVITHNLLDNHALPYENPIFFDSELI